MKAAAPPGALNAGDEVVDDLASRMCAMAVLRQGACRDEDDKLAKALSMLTLDSDERVRPPFSARAVADAVFGSDNVVSKAQVADNFFGHKMRGGGSGGGSSADDPGTSLNEARTRSGDGGCCSPGASETPTKRRNRSVAPLWRSRGEEGDQDSPALRVALWDDSVRAHPGRRMNGSSGDGWDAAAARVRTIRANMWMKSKTVEEEQQILLLLLYHSCKCRVDHTHHVCEVTPHCASVKLLWRHVSTCRDKDCTVRAESAGSAEGTHQLRFR